VAMEVEVLGVDSAPAGAIVSIRAGSQRRQAPVSTIGAGSAPFKFCTGQHGVNPFRIDLLQPVGSSRLALRPGEGSYTAELKGAAPNGGDVQVRFIVRDPGGLQAPPPCTAVNFDKLPAQHVEGPRGVDLLSPSHNGVGKSIPQLGKDEDVQFPIAAAAAKEYLESHRLLQFVRALLQAVIREQPEDPFAFISEQFRNASDAATVYTARSERGGLDAQEPINAGDLMHAEKKVPIPQDEQHQQKQTLAASRDDDHRDNEQSPTVAVCKSCNNSGVDMFGRTCCCAHGQLMKHASADSILGTTGSPITRETVPPPSEPTPFDLLPSTGSWMLHPTPRALLKVARTQKLAQSEVTAQHAVSPNAQERPSSFVMKSSPEQATNEVSVITSWKARHVEFHTNAVRTAERKHEEACTRHEGISQNKFENDQVVITMLLENVDFASITSHPSLVANLETLIKDVFLEAANAGPLLGPEHLDLRLSAGSLDVHCVISPNGMLSSRLLMANLDSGVQLSQMLASRVSGSSGIKQFCKGLVTVRNLRIEPGLKSEPSTSVPPAPPPSHPVLPLLPPALEASEAGSLPALSADMRMNNHGDQQDLVNLKAQARQALDAVLLDNAGDTTYLLDTEHLEQERQRARNVLNATVYDEDDIKKRAQAALKLALMYQTEALHGHGKFQELQEAKDKAKAALNAAIFEPTADTGGFSDAEMLERVKMKAQAALDSALQGEPGLDLTAEELDEVKLKAQKALNAVLDTSENAARSKARDALETVLLADDNTDDHNRELAARSKARDALETVLLAADDDVNDHNRELSARSKARDALENVLLADDDVNDDNGELAARSKARDALETVLLADDDVNDRNSELTARSKAREALESVLLDQESSALTKLASTERGEQAKTVATALDASLLAEAAAMGMKMSPTALKAARAKVQVALSEIIEEECNTG